MTRLPPAPPPGTEHPMALLLADLEAAREFEQAQLRRRGARPEEIASARRGTLEALTDYSDAITSRSWPVPRSIQLEIQLHRALLRL